MDSGLLYLSTDSKRNKQAKIVGILCVLGFFGSLYLSHDHYQPATAGWCDKGAMFSCSKVNHSTYSELLSVPVAFFGVVWNLAALYAAYMILQNNKASHHYITTLVFLSFFALLFVAYMVIAELIIGAICLGCTFVHILTLGISWYAWQLYKDLKVKPTVVESLGFLRNYYVAVAAGFLLVSVIAWSSNFSGTPENRPFTSDNLTPSYPARDDNFSNSEAAVPEDSPLLRLANCLTSNRVWMYGSDYCGVCRNQKSMFGELFAHVLYVNCADSDHEKQCEEMKVDRYPTWIQFTDDSKTEEKHRAMGYQDAQKLQEAFGCQPAPEIKT